MAPIEPDLSNSNTRPLLLLATLGAVNGTLTYIVAHRVLYRAYHALTPAAATRWRESRRRKHILAFQGLAFLSFSLALYYGFHLFNASYQVWAYERGELVPKGLWREGGLLAGEGSVSLKLGRWLKDTDLLAEIYESTLDRSRRQWWTQQLLLGGAVWSTYAAIEGRRRNIPHLWAFVALSITVSLSFAQNLFFLAILLSPAPLSEHDKHGDLIPTPQSPGKHSRKPSKAALKAAAKTESTFTFIPHRVQSAFESRFPHKPSNWVPNPFLFTITLLGSVVNTVLIAFASNTPSFRTFLFFYAVDLFIPHVFLRLAPVSWGSTSRSPSHGSQDALKMVGILSTAIYAIQSVIAVLDNSPPQTNRYYILPSHQSKRDRLAHPGYAVSRVLSSLGDHPAIGRIAWDVLLSGFSLVVWAGLRGADVSRMLRATGWVTKGEIQAAVDVKDLVVKEVGQLVNHVDEEAEEPTPKKSPARKSSSAKKKAGEEDSEEPASPTQTRARTRPAWSGEEAKEEDWEATALGWGMLVLGGLGVGTAAVLGSELI